MLVCFSLLIINIILITFFVLAFYWSKRTTDTKSTLFYASCHWASCEIETKRMFFEIMFKINLRICHLKNWILLIFWLTVSSNVSLLQVFQKELGKRTVSVQALKRSARELIENTHDDSSWVKVQMQELSTRWETVCNLSVSKQTRLEQALGQVFLTVLQTITR